MVFLWFSYGFPMTFGHLLGLIAHRLSRDLNGRMHQEKREHHEWVMCMYEYIYMQYIYMHTVYDGNIMEIYFTECIVTV